MKTKAALLVLLALLSAGAGQHRHSVRIVNESPMAWQFAWGQSTSSQVPVDARVMLGPGGSTHLPIGGAYLLVYEVGYVGEPSAEQAVPGGFRGTITFTANAAGNMRGFRLAPSEVESP